MERNRELRLQEGVNPVTGRTSPSTPTPHPGFCHADECGASRPARSQRWRTVGRIRETILYHGQTPGSS
ncbi:hypothetical protein GN956_G15262 [Arapaima gigas]